MYTKMARGDWEQTCELAHQCTTVHTWETRARCQVYLRQGLLVYKLNWLATEISESSCLLDYSQVTPLSPSYMGADDQTHVHMLIDQVLLPLSISTAFTLFLRNNISNKNQGIPSTNKYSCYQIT